jgi:hypothetical protein
MSAQIIPFPTARIRRQHAPPALTPELERELFDIFRQVDELNARVSEDIKTLESLTWPGGKPA